MAVPDFVVVVEQLPEVTTLAPETLTEKDLKGVVGLHTLGVSVTGVPPQPELPGWKLMVPPVQLPPLDLLQAHAQLLVSVAPAYKGCLFKNGEGQIWSPAFVMQSFAANGALGVGRQTAPALQPAPLVAPPQSCLEDVQLMGGTVFVPAEGGQLPPTAESEPLEMAWVCEELWLTRTPLHAFFGGKRPSLFFVQAASV